MSLLRRREIASNSGGEGVAPGDPGTIVTLQHVEGDPWPLGVAYSDFDFYGSAFFATDSQPYSDPEMKGLVQYGVVGNCGNYGVSMDYVADISDIGRCWNFSCWIYLNPNSVMAAPHRVDLPGYNLCWVRRNGRTNGILYYRVNESNYSIATLEQGRWYHLYHCIDLSPIGLETSGWVYNNKTYVFLDGVKIWSFNGHMWGGSTSLQLENFHPVYAGWPSDENSNDIFVDEVLVSITPTPIWTDNFEPPTLPWQPSVPISVSYVGNTMEWDGSEYYYFPTYKVWYNTGVSRTIIAYNLKQEHNTPEIHKCTIMGRRIIDVVYSHDGNSYVYNDYIRKSYVYSISAYGGGAYRLTASGSVDSTSYTTAFKNWKSLSGTWSINRKGKTTNEGSISGVSGEEWSLEYYNTGSATNKSLVKVDDTTIDLCEYVWIQVSTNNTCFIEPIVTRITFASDLKSITSIANAPSSVTESRWGADLPWIS